MSTNLPPSAVGGMFKKRQASETQSSLERANTEGAAAPAAEPESGESILKRTADSSARADRG